MGLLRIRTYPDRVLREQAKDVSNITGNTQRLVNDMIETMYAAPGVGLAAPQVGISENLLVIDVNSREEKKYPLIVLVNPVIMASEGTSEEEEGCLSLPDFKSVIERASKVFVKGFDREGKPVEIEADGLLAVALQHEIDHLRGKLILDKAGPLKRSLYKKRVFKKGRSE
ncbi:MAG: peptide deformylase [Nitrospiraceae bacterium]|nr:peptide deformylase [Nitrospiraceae bacterium]